MMISCKGIPMNLWRAMRADQGGNFGIITALLLPMALGTAGVAMDLTNVVKSKSELQNAADSAALAASSAMANKGYTEDEAEELAKKFLAAQLMNLVSTDTMTADEIAALNESLQDSASVSALQNTTAASTTYEVTVDGHFDVQLNPLSQLLGFETVSLDASATAESATESKNALSMYLVLDRSGSMAEDTETVNSAQPTKQVSYSCGRNTCYKTQTNYVTKIEALKIAEADLTAQLNEADPDKQYVRTAAISYNSSAQTPTSFEWGTATVDTYVNALSASGGTASTAAVKAAYQSLNATSEDAAHAAKNGQVPSKYIVFMTDGDNNKSTDDTQTLSWCTKAKDAGMEIFSVAFMAPSGGQALLKSCASSTSNYYAAADAEDLVAAFQDIGDKASQASNRLTN